jgi:hypothetical protein
MAAVNPDTALDARFSDGDATATPWSEAEAIIADAEISGSRRCGRTAGRTSRR